MTPQSDNDLHEAVRRALADWQPAPRPGDWERFRGRSRRRRWGWVTGLAVFGLLLLGGLGLWRLSPDEIVEKSPSRTKEGFSSRKAPLLPAPGCTPTRAAAKVFSRKKQPARPLDNLSGTQPNRVTRTMPPATPAARPTLRRLTAKTVRALATNLPIDRALIPPSPVEQEIVHQVLSGNFGDDSTSFRALERNKTRWQNAVLVCDATTSMYPYLTQLLAWFRKNSRNAGVKGFVFYTDCDSLGHQTDGSTPGKFFVSRRRDVSGLLPLLLAAARNTAANSDRDENAAEALRFAQHQFPEAQTLVLIADGRSGIKDAERLVGLTKPVAVVQCGPPDEPELAFQPAYWQLARQTNGSLHTLEDDLKNLDAVPENTWVRVGGQYYRFRRGRFVPTNFVQRPEKVLFFWLGRRK